MSEEERNTAEAKFKDIQEAYEVLSDPQKKRMFDSGAMVDGSSASGGHSHNPFSGYDMHDIHQMFNMGGGRRGFGGGGFPMDNEGHGGGFSFHFG